MRERFGGLNASGAGDVELFRYEVDGWGVGELGVRSGQVVFHQLPRFASGPPRTTTHVHSSSQRHERVSRNGDGSVDLRPRDRAASAAAGIVARLRRYFRGDAVDLFDVALDLDDLTPFGRDLAEALRAVPCGEIVSYGELAALAGRPGAARAAGTFCSRNRLSIFVPCHRVVAHAGLGGYGELGSAYKRRLLALEGVHLAR